MNVLVLPENSLDSVISLDILYWVKDLETTISMVARALRTGGRMGLFTNHNIGEVDRPGMLSAEHSKLFQALNNLALSFDAHDYTKNIGELWH